MIYENSVLLFIEFNKRRYKIGAPSYNTIQRNILSAQHKHDIDDATIHPRGNTCSTNIFGSFCYRIQQLKIAITKNAFIFQDIVAGWLCEGNTWNTQKQYVLCFITYSICEGHYSGLATTAQLPQGNGVIWHTKLVVLCS